MVLGDDTMKKILLTILALLICIPVFAGTVIYKLYPVNYPVFVDNQPIQSTLPVMTYNNNTYVPLKAVLDLMGAKTVWNGSVNINTRQADPKAIANSVVTIYVSNPGTDWIEQGSGVIIGYDEIITCDHVANKGSVYKIIYNTGATTTAKLIKDNPTADIALLEPLYKQMKPCKIGDSDEVEVGDKVFTISSPKEKPNVIAQGEVLDFESYKDVKGILTSAKVDFGSSGGPVYSSNNGELIGIIKAALQDDDCFMIPINEVRKAISK